MNGNKIEILTPLSILFLVLILIPITSSASVAGPVVPTDNSTLSRYCSNGICVFNGVQSFFNTTQGFYNFGNFTGGIHVDQSNLLGIQLSKTCIRLEENGLKSHCITYDKLLQWDNINQNYAGKFVNDTWFHRADPKIKQTWNFQTNKTLIMVDPDADFTTRAKMITVEDNNFTYINPDEIIGSNHTRTEYHNRFVASDCSYAFVAPNLKLIYDTIGYMLSGCTKTHYNNTSIRFTPNHGVDYFTKNTASVYYFSHFSNVTRLSNCIFTKCQIPLNPYHNHDPKFGW